MLLANIRYDSLFAFIVTAILFDSALFTIAADAVQAARLGVVAGDGSYVVVRTQRSEATHSIQRLYSPPHLLAPFTGRAERFAGAPAEYAVLS
jgi:hypothetical protein